MNKRRGLWVGLAVLCLLGGLFLQPIIAQAVLKVGEPAPGFTLQLFSGGKLALEELKGKPVVLNFWASW